MKETIPDNKTFFLWSLITFLIVFFVVLLLIQLERPEQQLNNIIYYLLK